MVSFNDILNETVSSATKRSNGSASLKNLKKILFQVRMQRLLKTLLRVDAPHCCRMVNGLTAAPGHYLISCTSKRTHTHPLPKHHPPAQNKLFETPFPPLLLLPLSVSFSSFASSSAPSPVPALHSCEHWLRSPPPLTPCCRLCSLSALLSPMSWKTHLSNTGSSSRRGSSSPVAKYKELWSKQVYTASPWGGLIFFSDGECNSWPAAARGWRPLGASFVLFWAFFSPTDWWIIGSSTDDTEKSVFLFHGAEEPPSFCGADKRRKQRIRVLLESFSRSSSQRSWARHLASSESLGSNRVRSKTGFTLLSRPRRRRQHADSCASRRGASFPYGLKPHPVSDRYVGKRRKGEGGGAGWDRGGGGDRGGVDVGVSSSSGADAARFHVRPQHFMTSSDGKCIRTSVRVSKCEQSVHVENIN